MMNNPSKSPGKAALSVWGQGNDRSWRLLSFAFSGYPVINSFKLSNNSRGWFLAHVRWICYINRSLPVSVQCTAPGSAFVLVVTLYHVFFLFFFFIWRARLTEQLQSGVLIFSRKNKKRDGEQPQQPLNLLLRNGPYHFHSHFIGKASQVAKHGVVGWESINFPQRRTADIGNNVTATTTIDLEHQASGF